MRTRRTLTGVLVALRAWWWALGGAALIYLGLRAPPGSSLQLAAVAGLVLVLVDLAFVTRRLVRLPGYGWPFVLGVIVVSALSALLQP